MDQQTKMSALLVGPMLVHQKSYGHFLAFGTAGICPQLNCLIAFGTDIEKAIGYIFHIQFPIAKHLLCFINMRNGIFSKTKAFTLMVLTNRVHTSIVVL